MMEKKKNRTIEDVDEEKIIGGQALISSEMGLEIIRNRSS